MPSRAITVIEFDKFSRDLSLAIHDIGTDVIAAQLITTIPVATAETNTAYTQVIGNGYTAGGIDLSAALTAGTPPQYIWETSVDTVWADTAGGFTDAVALLITNVTKGKHIAFADITVDAGTTPITNDGQPVDINWSGGVPGTIVTIN